MRHAKTIVSGLAILIAGAATLEATESSPNMDDSVISMRVKSALIASDATKATQINVQTRRGVVQLSGFVDSEAMRAAAVTTAKNVTGVKQVQNKLLIRDPHRTAGQAIDDTAIAAKVKGELAGRSSFSTATRVNVEVNSGIVELSGFVASEDEKSEAAAIARSVDGVKEVRNHIALRPAG